jgi:hypothetical protein
MQINKRPRVTNLQHPRVKIRTFNIQKQKPLASKSKNKKPSTSKNKSKNLEYPRIRARTFNI